MVEMNELGVDQDVPDGYEVVRGTVEVEVVTVVEKYVTDETKEQRLRNVVTGGSPVAPGANSRVVKTEVSEDE